MHVGDDGWMVEDAAGFPALTRVPSVRSGTLAADLKGPLGIVWHWTGGHCAATVYAQALAEEIRTYNKLTDRAASWHFLIAKNGRVIQSIQTNRGSWHVGRPGRIGGAPTLLDGKWDAVAGWGGRLFANINAATIGVELENSGRLEKVGERFYRWPFWLDPDKRDSGPDPRMETPAARAVLQGGAWYDEFPQAQEMAATRLLQACAVKFGWAREVCRYGHLMFDPSRREDPGALWLDVVLPRILDRVYGAK